MFKWRSIMGEGMRDFKARLHRHILGGTCRQTPGPQGRGGAQGPTYLGSLLDRRPGGRSSDLTCLWGRLPGELSVAGFCFACLMLSCFMLSCLVLACLVAACLSPAWLIWHYFGFFVAILLSQVLSLWEHDGGRLQLHERVCTMAICHASNTTNVLASILPRHFKFQAAPSCYCIIGADILRAL